MRVDLARHSASRPTEVYKAKLRTGMRPLARQTQAAHLAAIKKRIDDTPRLINLQDVNQVITESVDAFMDMYMEPDTKHRKWAPLKLNVVAVKQWLSNAGSDAAKRLKEAEFMRYLADLGYMSYDIKGAGKPRMNVDVMNKHQAAASIESFGKEITAMYSPMFQELRDRILSCAKPNVLINMKKDIPQIESFLNRFHYGNPEYEFIGAESYDVDDPRHPKNSTTVNMEQDFDNFDRSQGESVVSIELELYRRFGLDLVEWYNWAEHSEYVTVASIKTGLEFVMRWMRRTGSPTTAMGNTLVDMVSVARVYRFPSDFYYAMFLGDDSLISLKHKPERTADMSTDMARLTNLSGKLQFMKYGYFCSMFVIPSANNTIKYVPDPVKVMYSLGRDIPAAMSPEMKRIANQPIEARFVSLKDRVKSLSDTRCHQSLAHAVMERAEMTNPTSLSEADAMALINAVVSISLDRKLYNTMYDQSVSILTH